MKKEMTLPASKLVKNQKKQFGPVFYTEGKHNLKIIATVRHDDECGNGHNSFSITAEITTVHGRDYMGGCCHDEVAKHFPKLAPFIKWHLTSTDGPMHYVANTLYWLGYSGWCDGKIGSPPNLVNARACAVWPEMPESFLAPSDTKNTEAGAKVRAALQERLNALMAEFKAAVESLGFVY